MASNAGLSTVGDDNGRPRVSICVGSIRPGPLPDMVRSILAQSMPDWELIIATQGEDEELHAYVRSAVASDPRIRWVKLDRFGLSYARNECIKVARSDTLAFTDDDCTAPPDWLATGLDLLERYPQVGYIFGQMLPGECDPSEYYIPERLIQREERLRGRPWQQYRKLGIGGNMFARRSSFEKAGLFDELMGPGRPLLMGEEFDLTYRCLKREIPVLLAPTLQIVHWGARRVADGEGRRLVLAGYFGLGAGIGRNLRRGDGYALLALADLTSHLAGNALWRLAQREFPTGAGRVLAVLKGFVAGTVADPREGTVPFPRTA